MARYRIVFHRSVKRALMPFPRRQDRRILDATKLLADDRAVKHSLTRRAGNRLGQSFCFLALDAAHRHSVSCVD